MESDATMGPEAISLLRLLRDSKVAGCWQALDLVSDSRGGTRGRPPALVQTLFPMMWGRSETGP